MGCEVLIERDREGRSTKSPSPHGIPEEGIEIKPWGLLYLVGAPRGGLAPAVYNSDAQEWGGGGRTGLSIRDRWAEGRNTSKWAVWEEQRSKGLFCSLKVVLEKGVKPGLGEGPQGVPPEKVGGGCVSPGAPSGPEAR